MGRGITNAHYIKHKCHFKLNAGELVWNYVYGLGQRLARFNDDLLN